MYAFADNGEYITLTIDGSRSIDIKKKYIKTLTSGDDLVLIWHDKERRPNTYQKIIDYNDVTSPVVVSAAALETQILSWITSSGGTPTLAQVITSGDGGGLEITNIADGTAADSAATVGQLTAAIDAILYDYQIVQYAFNYGDSTTYYISGSSFTPVTANPDRIAIQVRQNIRIMEADLRWQSSTVAGSNENISIYIRVNNTTDYLIATIGSTDASKEFYNPSMNGGLGIDLTSADDWVIKIVTGPWGTNPTNTHIQGKISWILI